ncbi:MAG: EAL domain-containing protein, partial [Clostridia bacterium]|nr:EAL domain-containing protein [Clostridia bacterium]
FNGLGTSLVEILDKTDFDELFEIDTVKMRAFNIYHVEGKYLAPFMEGSHLDIYRYAADNMVHPDDREMHSRFMEPYTIYDRVVNDPDTPGLIHAEFRYRLLDGGWRWVEQLMVAGKEQGLPDGIIRVYVYDIQSRKDRELGNTVRFTEDSDSKRDEKTGLLPEKAFFIKAGRLLEDADRSWCLVTIDLEHFRLFNDWYGRDTGDVLIAQIGAELRRVEKSTGGAAGYFGQDDFCLVVPYDDAKIRRLHANLCKIVESHGSSFGFTPIFGVCMSDPTTSAAELYDRASIAQTFAKTKIQERISLFNNSMFDQTDKEYRILSDFRKGLKNREFFFVLQPQCRASTGKIVGAESLARWRKSDGTIVSPGVFVPVLEKYGFITVLDKFIWEEVCVWLRRWIDEGHKPLPISVNVSQIDIFGMDVAKFFEELVKKYDLSNDLIKIEITESAYVENGDVVRKTVQELRKKGFVVLMDDFGSGYSSLNMLRNLNVDVIKLDAQFLTTSQGDSVKGLHIIESIVNMVKTLELPIIVEGVEYREQREFLEDLGRRYVQGYFFYKPMAVELFEALISDQDNVDDRGFILKHNEQFRLREFLDENIYSDNMLNNILGPVCIYSRDDGRHVNI